MTGLVNQKEVQLAKELLELMQKHGVGNNTFNHYYINVTNFSPRSTDSQGTSAYKSFRRKFDSEKNQEIGKRQRAEEMQEHLRHEMSILKKKVFKLELTQSNSTSHPPKVKYLMSQVSTLKTEVVQLKRELSLEQYNHQRTLDLLKYGEGAPLTDFDVLFNKSINDSTEWATLNAPVKAAPYVNQGTKKQIAGVGRLLAQRATQLDSKMKDGMKELANDLSDVVQQWSGSMDSHENSSQGHLIMLDQAFIGEQSAE